MYYIFYMGNAFRHKLKPILIIATVISFSFGITTLMWGQYIVAILFSIIIPAVSLYFVISGRYKEKHPKEKKKNSLDNYFHHDNEQ
ncbi:MAG: hypothetical protein GY756_25525 [bacterium]|nr:hypothetical protein [bacterium]